MSAARFSETGTGFAYAKLSEILSAARDARFVRMQSEQAVGEPAREHSIHRGDAIFTPASAATTSQISANVAPRAAASSASASAFSRSR